jgi:hypothetical protein
MAIAGILTSLAMIYYFHINRKSKVIKKASPTFIQLMLLGLGIIYLSVLIWSLKPGLVSCSCHVILPVLGFNMVMSNLLAKSYRIWKIFNNVKVTALVITDADLFKFTFLTLLINTCLLMGFIAPNPPNATHIFFPGSDGQEVALTCSTDYNLVQKIFLTLLFVFNGLMIIFGCVMAYLTRKVDSAYNESKYITLVMYTILLLSLLVTPVYAVLLTSDSPEKYENAYVIRSVAFLILSSATILALFVPKIIGCEKLKSPKNQ